MAHSAFDVGRRLFPKAVVKVKTDELGSEFMPAEIRHLYPDELSFIKVPAAVSYNQTYSALNITAQHRAGGAEVALSAGADASLSLAEHAEGKLGIVFGLPPRNCRSDMRTKLNHTGAWEAPVQPGEESFIIVIQAVEKTLAKSVDRELTFTVKLEVGKPLIEAMTDALDKTSPVSQVTGPHPGDSDFKEMLSVGVSYKKNYSNSSYNQISLTVARTKLETDGSKWLLPTAFGVQPAVRNGSTPSKSSDLLLIALATRAEDGQDGDDSNAGGLKPLPYFAQVMHHCTNNEMVFEGTCSLASLSLLLSSFALN
jgi:hypothetical protein